MGTKFIASICLLLILNGCINQKEYLFRDKGYLQEIEVYLYPLNRKLNSCIDIKNIEEKAVYNLKVYENRNFNKIYKLKNTLDSAKFVSKANYDDKICTRAKITFRYFSEKEITCYLLDSKLILYNDSIYENNGLLIESLDEMIYQFSNNDTLKFEKF